MCNVPPASIVWQAHCLQYQPGPGQMPAGPGASVHVGCHATAAGWASGREAACDTSASPEQTPVALLLPTLKPSHQ